MRKSSIASRPLPLFAWVQVQRAALERRVRLRRILVPAVAGIACCGLTLFVPPKPRLLWNASASTPIGLYVVSPGAQPGRGELAIAWPPAEARRLAARRHYLPANVPLIKRVAAVSGDRICAAGIELTVNGQLVAARHVADAAGRPLPAWQGCVRLRKDELLLLMADSPASFDGRYFGPTSIDDVIGRAVPLWLR